MNSLEELCFVLVERQKANKLRLSHLHKYYAALKKLRKISRTSRSLKKKEMAEQLAHLEFHLLSYRRIADLMNDQRPLLRKLRKSVGAKMYYNGSNMCTTVDIVGRNYSWKQVEQMHNTYVFESVVFGRKKIDNPYSKELHPVE
jgi:hypothetical protein